MAGGYRTTTLHTTSNMVAKSLARRSAQAQPGLLGRRSNQLPPLWAVLGVRIVLPDRSAVIPSVDRLGRRSRDRHGWCNVYRSRLHIRDRRCDINGSRGTGLASRGSNHRSRKTQKQQWRDPAGIMRPALVTPMGALWVIPARAVGKRAAGHGGRQNRNRDGLENRFHSGPLG